MKTQFHLKKISLSIVLTLITSFALAGGGDAGGGKGVMCGEKLTVLDLYQEDLQDFSSKTKALPAEILNKIGRRFIDHFFSKAVDKDKILSELKSEFMTLSNQPNVDWMSPLPWTEDATLPTLENGCRFVQLAIHRKIDSYMNRPRVQFTYDPHYWSKLDIINKFALFLHEYSYSQNRYMAISSNFSAMLASSDETRSVIGALFSGRYITPIYSDDRHDGFCSFCEGNNKDCFEFYIDDKKVDGKSGVRLSFSIFKNFHTQSYTYAFVPDITTKDFFLKNRYKFSILRWSLNPYKWKIETQIYKPIMSKTWNLEMEMDKNDVNEWSMRVTNMESKEEGFNEFTHGLCLPTYTQERK